MDIAMSCACGNELRVDEVTTMATVELLISVWETAHPHSAERAKAVTTGWAQLDIDGGAG